MSESTVYAPPLPPTVTRYAVQIQRASNGYGGYWENLFTCATRDEAAGLAREALRDPAVFAACIQPTRVPAEQPTP